MAKPIQLHPKIRERKTPRVAAAALAEFIISAPDRQDDLLHDQRFSSAFVTPKYTEALRAIESFCADVRRPRSVLETTRKALETKEKSETFTPAQREEATRCKELLDTFSLRSNGLSVAGLPLMKPDDLLPMKINGLDVSVWPSLFVGTTYPPREGEKVGMVFIRPQKRPDPSDCKTESTKVARQEYRREVLRYMLVIGWMAFRAAGIPENRIDTKRLLGWDLRLDGGPITFPSDRVSRVKRIEAACGQIARLWDTISTKPSDTI